MSTPIANFREPIRAFLDDFNSVVRKYSDALIDAVVKNLVKCGQMEGYTTTTTDITPDIETVPVDYGRLVYKACLAIVAPRCAAYSYRTRAIGETFGNQRDFLMRLEGELFQLENGGNGGAMFNSFVDFQTWAMSVTGVNPWSQMTEMQVNSPVATVTVGRDGIQVNDA